MLMGFATNIKVKLISIVKRLFGKADIFVGRVTPEGALNDFFKSICPVETNHSLIRVGSDYDGGYLIPDDLDGVSICFSPGVSFISDFEMQMANRGITCFMADYSVDGPKLQHKLFHFEKKFIGVENTDVFMTLEDWVLRNSPGNREMILQMDIEGAEYEVIMSTSPEILRRFRIIVIEVHDLEMILSRPGYSLINQSFGKLLRDFEIVHIHPNNIMKGKRVVYKNLEIPSVLEISFLRKDRIRSTIPAREFPHKLDRPNSPEFEDYPLPRCWYRQQ